MDQIDKILSLREVVRLVDSGGDLDRTLRKLIEAACKYAGWTMGSIMAVDVDRGIGEVIVRHDPTLINAQLPDRWSLASSPSLVTLRRNEPVYIGDAQTCEDFPGYRSDALARDYRSVLVMPMNCRDAAGRPMVLTVIAREIKDLEDADLAFLGTIVYLGSIAVEREHRLAAQKQAAARLDKALRSHVSLLESVLGQDSLSLLVDQVGALLPNSFMVVDFTVNQLIAMRSPDTSLFSDADWQRLTETVLTRQVQRSVLDIVEKRGTDPNHLTIADGAHRHRIPVRVEPVFIEMQPLAAIVLFPAPDDQGDIDQLLLESARMALSVQVLRNHTRLIFGNQSQGELFRDIVSGSGRVEDELRRRAQRIGLDMRVPQEMVVIDLPAHHGATSGVANALERSLARIRQNQAFTGVSIVLDRQIVCLFPREGRGRERIRKQAQRLAEEMGHFLETRLIVVIDGPCTDLASYRAAWESCLRLIRIGQSFGLDGLLSVEDFGPLAMLVSALDAEEVRDYVRDSIGALVRHDREHNAAFLETLEAYLHSGCRAQACADAMGLHVSTLRYRLGRIRDLFDIDVETPEKRFAFELAVRLHRISRNV